MKRLILITLAVLLTASVAAACYKYKQCCKRTWQGLVCIEKCDYEFCPYNYPIEIK